MELDVGTLILEVTKRCNQQCEHCLRGHARNVDMSEEIIDKILAQTKNISSVVFTGGEPTLNLSLIEYFFNKVEELEVNLGAFWLATNGLNEEAQMKLCTILLSNITKVNEPEMCGVALSVDEFHRETAPSPLRYLAFYDNSKEHESFRTGAWVIAKGLAEENELDASSFRLTTDKFYVDMCGDDMLSVDTIYVDALGRLYADCDMTYEEQDAHPLGTVDDILKNVQDYAHTEDCKIA